MTDMLVQTLDYGVLGLCALMVVFAARVIYVEQKRDQQPRPGLMRFLYAFLGFCTVIAGLNAYVQVLEAGGVDSELHAQLQAEVANYKQQAALMRSKLDDINDALDDKSYTELGSLVATSDPVTRERLTRQIVRLKERIADAKKLVTPGTEDMLATSELP